MLFRSADVPHDDPMFLVALAAFVRRKARERSAAITGQLPGHGVKTSSDLVVAVLGASHADTVYQPVRIDQFDVTAAKADVVIGERHFAIQSASKLGDLLMMGTCNGKPFTAQVERGGAKNPLGIRVEIGRAHV